MQWIFITGEYPPAEGGVSDYTRAVAETLHSLGEDVTVLAPEIKHLDAGRAEKSGVIVKRLPGVFGVQALGILQRILATVPAGAIIVVQYVPQAFGWKGMNVPFCRILRAQKRHHLWIMFHELAFPIVPNQSWKHRLLALVNRWMVRIVVERAEHMFISTESWIAYLKVICGREIPTTWLPIPSSTERVAQTKSSNLKAKNFPFRIGHFGTFSPLITNLLEDVLLRVLKAFDNVEIYLIGRGSQAFLDRLVRDHSIDPNRISATGDVPIHELRDELSSCDLMIQPYPDGVSTRRSSVMAGVLYGVPIVTHKGEFTEKFWGESGAVVLLETMDVEKYLEAVKSLTGSSERRKKLGTAAAKLYERKFALSNTINHLLSLRKRSPGS